MLSTDFVNGDLSCKWGQKAKELMTEDKGAHKERRMHNSAQKKNIAETIGSLDDIKNAVDTTTIKIKESYQQQQQREEQLLARKSFGPYISSELLQVFDLFKRLPKHTPGLEDTLLLAGNSRAEEMGDGYTDNPIYGCVDLAELVKHRWMRGRPHFKSFLDKVAIMKRANINGKIYITLNRIILQICPLLTPKDRKELSDFFRVYREDDTLRGAPAKQFTGQQRKQLRKIFDFFDLDKSGTIDREEIRAALDRTCEGRVNAGAALVGQEVLQDQEQSIDDESLGSLLSEAANRKDDESVDSIEMDFPAFLQFFGQMFL